MSKRKLRQVEMFGGVLVTAYPLCVTDPSVPPALCQYALRHGATHVRFAGFVDMGGRGRGSLYHLPSPWQRKEELAVLVLGGEVICEETCERGAAVNWPMPLRERERGE